MIFGETFSKRPIFTKRLGKGQKYLNGKHFVVDSKLAWGGSVTNRAAPSSFFVPNLFGSWKSVKIGYGLLFTMMRIQMGWLGHIKSCRNNSTLDCSYNGPNYRQLIV